MEKINLGQTQLPLEVVLEYLETLKETYTAEVRLHCFYHQSPY